MQHLWTQYFRKYEFKTKEEAVEHFRQFLTEERTLDFEFNFFGENVVQKFSLIDVVHNWMRYEEEYGKISSN